MKIIFSPSKSQIKNGTNSLLKTTSTLFPNKVRILKEKILTLSLDKIQSLFKLSPKKSLELRENYKNQKAKKLPAIELFSGTSFKELKIEDYSTHQLEYMGNNLRILSALYGVLCPSSLISSYRLDMDNNILKDTKYKNLYNFWLDEITEHFIDETIIINLASKEYSKLIKWIDIKKIINIHFLVIKDGMEKTVSVISKQQRGKILNYIIKNEISRPEDIKKYSSDGFIFNPKRSDKNNYYFIQNANN